MSNWRIWKRLIRKISRHHPSLTPGGTIELEVVSITGGENGRADCKLTYRNLKGDIVNKSDTTLEIGDLLRLPWITLLEVTRE